MSKKFNTSSSSELNIFSVIPMVLFFIGVFLLIFAYDSTKQFLEVALWWAGILFAGLVVIFLVASTASLLYWIGTRYESYLKMRLENRMTLRDMPFIRVSRSDSLLQLPNEGTQTPIQVLSPYFRQGKKDTVLDEEQLRLPDGTLNFAKDLYLEDFVGLGTIDQEKVILGIDEAGNPLSLPLGLMQHTIILSSSGWGKSTLLQLLAMQFLLSRTPVKVSIVDFEGITFRMFRGSKRLAQPVIGKEADLKPFIDRMTAEAEARLSYLRSQSLENWSEIRDYSTAPYHVIIVEEATKAFKKHPALHDFVADIAMSFRKVGMFLIIAGHQFTKDDIATIIKRQVSTTIVLKTKDVNHARAVGFGKETVNISLRGVAYVEGIGIDSIMVKIPMLRSKRSLLAKLYDVDIEGQAVDYETTHTEDVKLLNEPEIEDTAQDSEVGKLKPEIVDAILTGKKDGLSISAISMKVFKNRRKETNDLVRKVLSEHK